MFFKIGVLRNFAVFTGKHLCWSLFLIKVQAKPATLFKRDFNTSAFLWMWQNFYKHLFFIEHVRWYLSISSYLSKIMWDGFYYKGLHIWSEFVIYILLVETIPTSFYWLTCRKQKLVQSKALQQRLFVLMLGFWQCRQAFVHYLMSLLMIWKWTRGYIYQVAAMEFAFAATCSEK